MPADIRDSFPETAEPPAIGPALPVAPRSLGRRLASNLTVRVLLAIALGALVGALWPDTGKALKPLGDVFIDLVRMVIAPIIFLTVVLGIGNMQDIKKVGRVGGKAFLYFEVVTTIALAIGIVVMNVTRPGAMIDAAMVQAATTTASDAVTKYATQGQALSVVDFLVHIVPTSVIGAFAQGEILQVVLFAVLFGFALTMAGPSVVPLIATLERLTSVFFTIVRMVMTLAPIGAFGAMAYTIGAFGLKTLLPLGRLMLDVYLTMAIFIFVVLNLIMKASGFSLWELLVYIRQELVLVLGTSSSESALPSLMQKLERYGASKTVVGLVVPAGYSFNLDGTSIYLAMATLFIAQAFKVDLTIGQQISVLLVLMITSKGAAGVTGSGFVVLASTLAALKVVPIQGLALLLGVDRFMSEARSITNLIGNAVATLVVARSEGAFDDEKRRQLMESRER